MIGDMVWTLGGIDDKTSKSNGISDSLVIVGVRDSSSRSDKKSKQ